MTWKLPSIKSTLCVFVGTQTSFDDVETLCSWHQQQMTTIAESALPIFGSGTKDGNTPIMVASGLIDFPIFPSDHGKCLFSDRAIIVLSQDEQKMLLFGKTLEGMEVVYIKSNGYRFRWDLILDNYQALISSG
jgi:hypothetical protein